MSTKLSRWILKSLCHYLLIYLNIIFSNLKISLLTKSVIFGSLRMTVIHTKNFFNSFTYCSLINTDDVFWKKRWVCKYLALSTSVEENKNSVKLDFMSFWRLTKIQFHNYFLTSGIRVFWHNTTPFILSLVKDDLVWP